MKPAPVPHSAPRYDRRISIRRRGRGVTEALPHDKERPVVGPAPDPTFVRALLIGSMLSAPLWIVALSSILHLHHH